MLRRYQAYQKQPTNVARHINLRALQDTNETLFYRLVGEHIEEMLPIIYTPTVGVACQYFSEIYRRPRGLFISYPDRHRIGRDPAQPAAARTSTSSSSPTANACSAWEIRASVVWASRSASFRCTRPSAWHRPCPYVADRSSMPAPTTPSSSMTPSTSAGAIAASTARTTTTSSISSSRQCATELPGRAAPMGGLRDPHALPILERYRDHLLTFNDDIQGTAAMVLAALSAAGSCQRFAPPRSDHRDGRGRFGRDRSLRADHPGHGGGRPLRGRPPAPGCTCSTSTVCSPPIARTSTPFSAASPSRRAPYSSREPGRRTDLHRRDHRGSPHRTHRFVGGGRRLHRSRSSADGGARRSGRSSCRCRIRRAVARHGRRSSPTGPMVEPSSPADLRSGPCRRAVPASRSPNATTSTPSPASVSQ